MSGSDPAIVPVGPADIAALADALAALSADLGDTHRAGARDLARACLGPAAVCRGLLARAGGARAGGAPVGAALVSAIFSTTQGAAGAYVSDLWVAPAHRGRGLGRALLAAAAALAARRWEARFLKLAVYAGNAEALDFYRRLGFRHAAHERALLLPRDAFDNLGGDPR